MSSTRWFERGPNDNWRGRVELFPAGTYFYHDAWPERTTNAIPNMLSANIDYYITNGLWREIVEHIVPVDEGL